MFDRPAGSDDAVIVSLDFGDPGYEEGLEELKQLAVSAGMNIRGVIEGRRDKPDAKYFVGSGKAEELKDTVKATESKVALFNHDLSPSQQRNLERLLECRVADRTGLILDIFAQRAKTHEGKLQVELAQLEHLSTRLVRGWTHLERQKGGIGVRGGPGETQLELDRRMLRIRVKQLREKLEKLKQQRGMQRRSRKRSQVMSVSLVGYTNAGKSTLFNRLTQSKVYAADQLFATLDTTTRQLYLGEAGRSASVSDTVGFIRDLPHGLIDAFQATLQEAADADLLIHVVDASNPNFPEQMSEVQRVLYEIGADHVPQWLVFNKIDNLPPERRPLVFQDEYEVDGQALTRIFVSAQSGEGLPLLRQWLAQEVLTNSTEPTPASDPRFALDNFGENSGGPP